MSVIVSILSGALWCSFFAQTQLKPDLSGQWTLDMAATAAAYGGGGAGISIPAEVDGGGAKAICGRTVTLTQTADRLLIERELGDRSVTAAFRVDGTPTKHAVLGCRVLSKAMEREAGVVGAPTEMTTTATWNGASLIVRSSIVGGTGEVEQMLTIQEDKSLLVETTILRSNAPRRPVKAVYRKR